MLKFRFQISSFGVELSFKNNKDAKLYSFFNVPEVPVTKLSTFSSAPITAPSKSSMVQLRRPTNRKGKTAPAPPKRTR